MLRKTTTTKRSFTVPDSTAAEPLSFTVPADFFDVYPSKDPSMNLKVIRAREMDAAMHARAEALHHYTAVWTPDGDKWDFIEDVWISDTCEMRTGWELLHTNEAS